MNEDVVVVRKKEEELGGWRTWLSSFRENRNGLEDVPWSLACGFLRTQIIFLRTQIMELVVGREGVEEC